MDHCVAVDVGGTTTKCGLVSAGGVVIAPPVIVPTPKGADAVVDNVVTLVREMSEVARDQGINLQDTVGVCVPGIVDAQLGLAQKSTNLGWPDVPMRAELERHLGTPVAFGQDVRSGVLAEARWGSSADTDIDTFIYVPIGTGLATALVVDGDVADLHPWSGELGQMILPESLGFGRGLRLEEVCSASRLVNIARDRGLASGGVSAKDILARASKDPKIAAIPEPPSGPVI